MVCQGAIEGLALGESAFGKGRIGEDGPRDALEDAAIEEDGKGRVEEVPGVCSSRRRLVRISGVPPPRAMTVLVLPSAETRAVDSRRRKWDSPWRAKMSGTEMPVRDSM